MKLNKSLIVVVPSLLLMGLNAITNSSFQFSPITVDLDLEILAIPVAVGLILSNRISWVLTVLFLTVNIFVLSDFALNGLLGSEYVYIQSYPSQKFPVMYGYILFILIYLYFGYCFYQLFKKKNRPRLSNELKSA